jgi:hypothetical protein
MLLSFLERMYLPIHWQQERGEECREEPRPLIFRKMEETVKYLCLVYVDQKEFDARWSNVAEIDELSLDYDDQLRRTGHYISSAPLQSPRTARTVRVRSSKVSTTDGPFAETKEHLGGFILIEAKDLDEAVALASKIPLAQVGSIEVRPLMELKRS